MAHHHPDLPNLGDITALDWQRVPSVSLLTAGYPCQPFSLAGQRRGEHDERHLWPYIAEGIRVLRPAVVVLENVPGHRSRGLSTVLGDLASLGYRSAWGSVRAADVGAPHARERLCVVAADPRHGHLTPWTRPAGRALGQRQTERQEPAGLSEAPARAEQVDWIEFASAVEHWANVLGRPAPVPWTVTGRGSIYPSPEVGEWLMGLPEGHISSVPGLSIQDQHHLIGNGVVPPQLAHAIRALVAVLDSHLENVD